MKLSEMRQLLADRGIQLTKSLGQNFLHDGNLLRRIAAAAEITSSDRVLEIGPGLGPLTELLVAQAGEVLAIEKDPRLVAVLRERFAGVRNLNLLQADALEHLRQHATDWSGWKMISNLPYSVASPILVELAQGRGDPERIVATVQLEVARRLLAGPGDKDYGVLTLLVQLSYQPRGQFKIPASCFFPEPEVDSACLTLDRRPQPLLRDEQRATFVRLVKGAFSQRRKIMFKLLKSNWPEPVLSAAFTRTGLDPGVRAERVGLDPFVQLACLLHPEP
jgi:16S rRNA (adenine1518-N6/adenine1519-N6)-dimethyltransferase